MFVAWRHRERDRLVLGYVSVAVDAADLLDEIDFPHQVPAECRRRDFPRIAGRFTVDDVAQPREYVARLVARDIDAEHGRRPSRPKCNRSRLVAFFAAVYETLGDRAARKFLDQMTRAV